MYFKYQALLHHFKFNRNIQTVPIFVVWFKYELDENVEENTSRFSYEEVNMFQNFLNRHSLNFEGPKDYLIADESEVPLEVVYDLLPNPRITFPEYLILRPEPKILNNNQVQSTMQILLLNKQGSTHHSYNLPFGAIGRIQSFV